MSLSAIPASGAPPTIGETPTTGPRRAATASRTPGSARIGAIETTGFDGQINRTSASAIASRIPGAGLACSIPSNLIAFT